jgi:hypothetical protein
MLQPGQEVTAKEKKLEVEVEELWVGSGEEPSTSGVVGWTPLLSHLSWILGLLLCLAPPVLGQTKSSSRAQSSTKVTNQGSVIVGQEPPNSSTGPRLEPKGFVMVVDPLG